MSGIYIIHCNNFQYLIALFEKAHQQNQLQLVYFIVDYREREVPGEGKAISLHVILAFFFTLKALIIDGQMSRTLKKMPFFL